MFATFDSFGVGRITLRPRYRQPRKMRHSLPGTSRVCNLEWQPETASALQESSLRPGHQEAQLPSLASCVPLQQRNLGTISRVGDTIILMISRLRMQKCEWNQGVYRNQGQVKARESEAGKGQTVNEAGWVQKKEVAAAAVNGSRQRRRVSTAKLKGRVVIHPTRRVRKREAWWCAPPLRQHVPDRGFGLRNRAVRCRDYRVEARISWSP